MDTTFRDKLLTCTECGNEFVYTVGQQRMAYEETGQVSEPALCPVCEVKIERMGRREEPTNGHGGHSHSRDEQPARPSAPYTNGTSRSPVPAAWEESDDEPEPEGGGEAAPTNGASSYRSGDAHPLHGHHGEQYSGHVKWFNDRKGFGFIILDSGIEIFVHYSGIVGEGYKTLHEGQRVRITVEDTTKGPQASEVAAFEQATVGEEGAQPEAHSEFSETG